MPPRAALWFGVGVVLHDAASRLPSCSSPPSPCGWVPAPGRVVVLAALCVSATLSLVALPLLLDRGGAPDNPTADPLPYPRNLLLDRHGGLGARPVVGLVAHVRLGPARRTCRR